MKINSDLTYRIGQGGLIDGKLIFIHPRKIKFKPWVARCFKDKDNIIQRAFLEGWRENYDDDHYLMEFDLEPFEIYQYGNIYLGNNSPKDSLSNIGKDDLYKSYAATSIDEFVEIELESVLVFMNLYKGKKKRDKRTTVTASYAPDDIDF